MQDVAFDLVFDGQTIGTANIPGLILTPGENLVATQVRYQPQGAARATGQRLLERFIQGTPSDTIISGGSKTTPIASLSAALASIRLATTIPPITENLISEARLSFDVDIGKTGVANAAFILSNPFTASINLISVVTNATYGGILLGNINVGPGLSRSLARNLTLFFPQQQNLKPPIHAPGHTATLSPTLPLALNTDPRVLIQFIEAAARDQDVDLGILGSHSSPCAQMKTDYFIDSSAIRLRSRTRIDRILDHHFRQSRIRTMLSDGNDRASAGAHSRRRQKPPNEPYHRSSRRTRRLCHSAEFLPEFGLDCFGRFCVSPSPLSILNHAD